MKILALALAMTTPAVAHAQIIVGAARVIDGDTIEIGSERVRLFGIDAPERDQTCNRNGEAWACGQDATAALRQVIGSQTVQCDQRETDIYGRAVAVCLVSRVDLGKAMIQGGLAVALPNAGADYVASEAKVKGLAYGIWGSKFELPSDYRAKHPRQFAPPPRRGEAPAAPRSSRPAPRPRSDVYYRNCAQAWAAGAAPLYRGQPGYRPEMDGDRDGVACEPFRRR